MHKRKERVGKNKGMIDWVKIRKKDINGEKVYGEKQIKRCRFCGYLYCNSWCPGAKINRSQSKYKKAIMCGMRLQRRLKEFKQELGIK